MADFYKMKMRKLVTINDYIQKNGGTLSITVIIIGTGVEIRDKAVFHFLLMLLGKAEILLFSLELLVKNSQLY